MAAPQRGARLPSPRLCLSLSSLFSLFALASLLSAAAASSAAAVGPEERVDTLGGTDSRFDLSHGNLLPLVARPWGMHTFAPVTDNDPTYHQWWCVG